MKNIKLYNGDCLEVMKGIPDGSVDMVMTDMPYNVSQNEWDKAIDLSAMWHELKRIIKPNGAMVFTATQPFTTLLIASNLPDFKYNWYWHKNRATGVFNAKKQPLRNIEEVCVFHVKEYKPQGLVEYNKPSRNGTKESSNYGKGKTNSYTQAWTNYPKQLLSFDSVQRVEHPTQKPVALMEYLIKTYTNEHDVVIDMFMGSGTTGVAAVNTNRNFIGIEKDEGYFKIAEQKNKKKKAMAKINLDKYYTPSDLAGYCVKKTKEIVGVENITEWLEPSAGAGVFLPYLDNNYLAFDIEPEADNIEQKNYLELDLPYLKGRCVIGNPPFGRNTLALQFMRKAIKEADYIAYILPVSQYNNNYQLFEFNLVYSEILPEVKYSGRLVKCCFNIYKRPIRELNKNPNYELKDVEIFEYRRNEKQVPDLPYDYRMCSYGSNIGKKCNKADDYVKEICIVINNHKDKVVECLDNADWKKIVPPTTTPSLPQWRVLKYLREQIPQLV